MPDDRFSIALTLDQGYTFEADFRVDGVPALQLDEPAPLGKGRGPNPTRLLAAAVGQCLGSSLLYCLRKARIEVTGLGITVDGSLVRNERQRLRVGELRVTLTPTVATKDQDRVGRCTELFEDFCIVTESVRNGIDVRVAVKDASEPIGGQLAALPRGADT